ncbi:unnamed protein product [Fraxinus pennsylvanica]|uniref:Uncharacterized protein n=1 Tax=Fraxinus pennsylvanica TaxID=56036 RepID=A0AAD2AK19_9LAMI|nr:unnamed protein product [Fraxinus pennsylvanica]
MMILAGDEFSFGNKWGLNGTDREGPVLSKLGSTSELRPKPDAEPKTTAMPPTSVMTRLILIMVWRKLIRNPNTYSSLIGLTCSLVSFKWHGEMPTIIAKSIAILSDADLGMAMGAGSAQNEGWNFRCTRGSAPEGSWDYQWGIGLDSGGNTFNFGSGSSQVGQHGGGGFGYSWGGSTSARFSNACGNFVYGGGGSRGESEGGGGGGGGGRSPSGRPTSISPQTSSLGVIKKHKGIYITLEA